MFRHQLGLLLLNWPGQSLTLIALMDKETIVLMLQSIKDTAAVGPKTGAYDPGDRVVFAIDHGLLLRSDNGNLVLSVRGEDLLAGKLEWTNL